MNQHAGPNVKLYLSIFGALLVLTVLTVLVSYWHLERAAALTVGLTIAVVKASLVAAFFMHLKGERTVIFGLLGVTVFFMMALFVLSLTDTLQNSERLEHAAVAAEMERAPDRH